MYNDVWNKYKNLAFWQQALFAVFVLAVIGLIFYKSGIIKLSSSKPFDCGSVTGFQTFQINIGKKFDPDKLDVYLCDHLIFKATDDEGHWPAAGPHPTHTSYPGFDSLRSLHLNETYEVTLNKPGSFEFHDHLHEQVVGTVNIQKSPRQAGPPDRPSAQTDKKTIYLTFDADMTQGMRSRAQEQGLVWYDVKLTDYLIENKIPATIYVTGMFGEMYPELVTSLSHNMNIEIGNHTYDHEAFESPCYNLRNIINLEIKKQEIAQTQSILKSLIGYEPKYFRFPGLCHNTDDDQLVSSMGLIVGSDDLVSGDAFASDSDRIVYHVINKIKNGSVVVMHLGGPNAPATFDALTKLVPEIEKAGYTLATMSPRAEVARK